MLVRLSKQKARRDCSPWVIRKNIEGFFVAYGAYTPVAYGLAAFTPKQTGLESCHWHGQLRSCERLQLAFRYCRAQIWQGAGEGPGPLSVREEVGRISAEHKVGSVRQVYLGCMRDKTSILSSLLLSLSLMIFLLPYFPGDLRIWKLSPVPKKKP